MQHAYLGLVRAGGDEHVGGRQAVMADASKVGLRLSRDLLDGGA